MTHDDPARWPDTPPPLPPTLPGDGRATAEAWAVGATPPPSYPGAPGPQPGQPGPPSGPGRSAITIAVIAVVAVLLLTGGVVAVAAALIAARAPDDTAAPTTSTTEAPTTTTEPDGAPATTDPDRGTGSDPDPGGAGSDPELEAEIAELTAFVEQERGLEFREPVEVTVLDTDDFKDRVLDEFETEQEALEDESALLRASGIVPPDTDLVQAQLDLLGEGVLGFYDPIGKELVVRRDSTGPLLRSVIVHELTHALDDQHFDLDRPAITGDDDDRAWAFLALVEGSAKRVEQAYLDQLDDDELAELQDEQMQLGLDQMATLLSVPLVLAQLQMSPYDYGAPFVAELFAEDGQAGLDAAFDAPPMSSEQVLGGNPFDADGPIEVSAPPADGELLDEGTLGELMTGFLLADPAGLDSLLGGLDQLDPEQLDEMLEDLEDMLDSLESGDPSDPGGLGDLGGLGGTTGASGFPPVATTDGWGGDRYVVWESGDQVCLRVDWVMDTPEALATFRGALATWAARDAAVVLEDPEPGVARATRCAAEPTSSR